MCGIAGFLDVRASLPAGNMRAVVGRMTDTQVHRGPDDNGVWVDAEAGVALGHRRLSIIDITSEGHQPMVSACGRYVIAFNGEIYNFLDVRKDLENADGAPGWRGHSDTEVMLAAISHWGLEEAVKRFVGMFAFALWDRKERVLHLARDRLGEKPLYYGWMNGAFLFGSELKALRAYPGWQGEIDRDALALFLRHNYIPSPYSIYKGICKLPPGAILSMPAHPAHHVSPAPRRYWWAREVAEEGIKSRFRGSETEAAEELERLLRQSIGMQMVADVPLGAFLSGGIDSSVVVALMQAQSPRPVKTFTIGFHEDSYNEAKYARAVASHLGTDHTELYVTPKEAMDVVPRLPELYDEPFSDSSQIPTFLAAELARRHVTVSLSGDGGDELFGGYNRYFWGRAIWRGVGWMPRGLRAVLAKILVAVSPGSWETLFRRWDRFLPAEARHGSPGDKLHKLAEILAVNQPEAMYLGLVSHWKTPASIVLGAREPVTALTDSANWPHLTDITQRMMYLDLISYLPDDILVKVDRAAMGASLETRIPMLDHRVVEFAWRLPLFMKVRNGQGKWLLRQVLYKYVPKDLVERPKTGFGIPIDSWLRGSLREWAESLLDESRLRHEGFFDPAPIREKWTQHQSGERNWQYYLWDVLMFQAWLDHQRRESR